MTFFLATTNQNKLAEATRILLPLGITLRTARDLGADMGDIAETGATFAENARIKARHGCLCTGLPCLADDSGLCVEALGGRPGVHTARYAAAPSGGIFDTGGMRKLLTELEGVEDARRGAAYVCAIVCAFPGGEELYTEARCGGRIGHAPVGESGFGYDPLFFPDDYRPRSMAQCTHAEKDKISHRGRALRALAILLRERGYGSE
jgi:XTP/dITP diphosphohydrolase